MQDMGIHMGEDMATPTDIMTTPIHTHTLMVAANHSSCKVRVKGLSNEIWLAKMYIKSRFGILVLVS